MVTNILQEEASFYKHQSDPITGALRGSHSHALHLDLACLGLDAAGRVTGGAGNLGLMSSGDVIGSGGLNQATKSLADLMSGHLDLVIVRCAGALPGRLQPSSSLGSLLQRIRKFLFKQCFFRVSAYSPGRFSAQLQPPQFNA